MMGAAGEGGGGGQGSIRTSLSLIAGQASENLGITGQNVQGDFSPIAIMYDFISHGLPETIAAGILSGTLGEGFPGEDPFEELRQASSSVPAGVQENAMQGGSTGGDWGGSSGGGATGGGGAASDGGGSWGGSSGSSHMQSAAQATFVNTLGGDVGASLMGGLKGVQHGSVGGNSPQPSFFKGLGADQAQGQGGKGSGVGI